MLYLIIKNWGLYFVSFAFYFIFLIMLCYCIFQKYPSGMAWKNKTGPLPQSLRNTEVGAYSTPSQCPMKFLDTLIHTMFQILKIGYSCMSLHKIFNEINVPFCKDDFLKRKSWSGIRSWSVKWRSAWIYTSPKGGESKVDDNTQTLIPRPKSCL